MALETDNPIVAVASRVLEKARDIARKATQGSNVRSEKGVISCALKSTFGEHGLPQKEGVFFIHTNGRFSHTPQHQNHTDAILDSLPENTKRDYGCIPENDGEERFDLDKDRIDSPLLRDAYNEGLIRGRLLNNELHICHHERGITPSQEKSIRDIIVAHDARIFLWDAVSDGDKHFGGSGVESWNHFLAKAQSNY